MTKPVKVSERTRQALAMKVNGEMLARKHNGFVAIIGQSMHVVVYALSRKSADAESEWTRDEYEGSLFIGQRQPVSSADNQARFFLFVYNRKNMADLTDFLVRDMNVERHDHMVMYRNATGVTRALWFYDKADVDPIADLLEAVANGDPVAKMESPEIADQGNGVDEGMTSPPDVVSTPAIAEPKGKANGAGAADKKESVLKFFPNLEAPESGIVGSPVPANVHDPAVLESGEPLPPSVANMQREPTASNAVPAPQEPPVQNEEAIRREQMHARSHAHARAAAEFQYRAHVQSLHAQGRRIPNFPMPGSIGMPVPMPPHMHPGMHGGQFVNPQAAQMAAAAHQIHPRNPNVPPHVQEAAEKSHSPHSTQAPTHPQHPHPMHAQHMAQLQQPMNPPAHGQPPMAGHPVHPGQVPHMPHPPHQPGPPPYQQRSQHPMGPGPFAVPMPHPAQMGYIAHPQGGAIPAFFAPHMNAYSPPGAAGYMAQGPPATSNPDSPRMMHPYTTQGPGFRMHPGGGPQGWGNPGGNRDSGEQASNAILGYINGNREGGKSAGNGQTGRSSGAKGSKVNAAASARMISQGMAQLDIHGDVGGQELSVNDFRSVIQRMLTDQRLFGKAYEAYKAQWVEQKKKTEEGPATKNPGGDHA